MDFLLRSTSNSINDVKVLIDKVIDTPTGNDYIAMTAKGFEEISPQRKYHGISAQIIAQIKNVRIPFNVDIGVGDVIVPHAEDEDIQKRWKYFLKNIKDDTLKFSVVIAEIQVFLEPVFDAMVNEEEWLNKWGSKASEWSNFQIQSTLTLKI